jgi:hypothetical protein
MIIAIFAKTNARRYCHLGLQQQFLGKFQRSQGTIGLGNGGPNKHSAARFFNLLTYRIKPIAEHIAAFPVQIPDLSQVFLRPPSAIIAATWIGVNMP